VPNRDQLADQIKALEKRIKKLEEEIADLEKHILEKMARILHGPSQPPPPITSAELPATEKPR
jgi:cell division protein FtsB